MNKKEKNPSTRKGKGIVFLRIIALSIGITFVIVLAIMLPLAFIPRSNGEEVSLQVEKEEKGSAQVSVYSNGLVFVSYNYTFEKNGTSLELPAGVILETLRIEGVGIDGYKEKVSGDVMHVKTETREYEGVFKWEDENFIAVQDAAGNVWAIEKGKIEHYVPGSPIQEIEVIGSGNASISYLISGGQWFVSYDFNMDTGELVAKAYVKIPIEAGESELSLYSGEPYMKIEYGGGARLEGKIPAAPISWPEEEESIKIEKREKEEFLVFELENVDLKQNTINSLDLFKTQVELDEFSYWSEGRVKEKITLENTRNETLPAGIINFYRDNVWLGNNHLDYLSPGEKTDITVGYQRNVDVEKKLTEQQSGFLKETKEFTITIQNFANESIKLKIEQWVPEKSNIRHVSPKAEVIGNSIIWKVEILPKQTLEFVYSYTKVR
jgi:hypothetical protein